MDKPTTPAGPKAPNSPSPEDSGSEQDLGATGVFGVVKAPEPVEGLAADSGAEPDAQGNRAPEAAKPQPVPQPVPAPKALAEPVVHRVVFGGGAAESSPELLDRMRMASAGRAPIAEKPSASETGGKGGAGFTELLRTLGSDAPVPAGAPAPETPRPAQDSGFTSLFRAQSSQEAGATRAEESTKPTQPGFRSISEESRSAPAAPAPSGFTELLRATPEGRKSGGPQAQAPDPGEAPVAGRAGGAIPSSVENKPGTFTQLFSSFGDVGTSPPAPPPMDRGTEDSSRGSAGSFTRMLSLEPQSTPAEPAYREERKPSAGSLDYDLTPQTARPAEASRDPFSSSPQPVQSTPPPDGAGITRLIQMLDDPSKTPAPRAEVAPVSPPGGAEPGVWTQTFAALATPNEPSAPTAKAPELAPQEAPPGATGYPVSREASFPAGLNEPAVPAPPAGPGASGPSEFTRILDASRLREQAMRSAPGAENLSPPPPQNFASAPPPAQIPNYPVSVPSPVREVQGMGGMPHPGVYPPPQPQLPGYPMNYGPHAGAIPTPGGGMPQPPGMYVPVPPMPIAPQAPPVKAAEPGTGKTQQYLLVMGVVIIVLLVALLVTVIFLMKH
ncbi:MAG: hypothetical protein ACLQLH_12835 [Terracidiphilus sp.]